MMGGDLYFPLSKLADRVEMFNPSDTPPTTDYKF